MLSSLLFSLALVSSSASTFRFNEEAVKKHLSNRLSNQRDGMFDHILPAAWKGAHLHAVKTEVAHKTVVQRFLQTIMGSDATYGQLVFKLYGEGDTSMMCGAEDYIGEVAVNVNTCYKAVSVNGTIGSLMIMAGNGVDSSGAAIIETDFKMYGDNMCQTPHTAVFGSMRDYPATCVESDGASTIFEPSMNQMVEFRQQQLVHLKKIKASTKNYFLIASTDTMHHCNKNQLAYYQVAAHPHCVRGMTQNWDNTYSEFWMTADCTQKGSGKLVIYKNAECQGPKAMGLVMMKAGCGDNDDDDENDGDEDDEDDDDNDNYWAPWGGLNDPTIGDQMDFPMSKFICKYQRSRHPNRVPPMLRA